MDDPEAVVSGRRTELARELLLLVLNWSIFIGCVAGLIVGAIQHAPNIRRVQPAKSEPDVRAIVRRDARVIWCTIHGTMDHFLRLAVSG